MERQRPQERTQEKARAKQRGNYIVDKPNIVIVGPTRIETPHLQADS